MSGKIRWLLAAICWLGVGLETHAQLPSLRPTSTFSIMKPKTEPAMETIIADDGGCENGDCDPVIDCPDCDLHPSCLGLWANFEYLHWWTKSVDSPPLVTTSTPGTPRDDAGVLGVSSTSTLFGGDDAESGSGGRLTIGLWLAPDQSAGIFARGFTFEPEDVSFQSQSFGRPILARPFFNVLTDQQDALLMGFPNQIEGDIDATFKSRTSGIQALVRRLYRQECNYRIDLVYGYRYVNVEDSLRVNDSLEFTDRSSSAFGNTIQQFDLFDMENEFHGGELGIMGHSVDGRFTMDFLLTVALGSIRERAAISGQTVTTPLNGNPFTANGGLLTQESNIGVHENDQFAVIPEATVSLGYFITPRLDVSIGYTFLYMSHVMRAADAIDLDVNLNQQTGGGGPGVPNFTFDDSDYWVQGINVGLNWRY